MKKTFYALMPLLALFVALVLRLYPTLISGMPFSTDAWPLIRNTELLVQNTPLSLGSSIFDGYNNFWPATSLFGAVFSQIVAVPPAAAMAIGVPVVSALAVVPFYLVAKKITANCKAALSATVLFACAFPLTMFSAGVTKETFAVPISITLILLFLFKHDWKIAFLFSVASVTLVLAHHLTAFLTVGILVSLTVASVINKDQKPNSANSNLMFLGVLSTVLALYFGLYAYSALTIPIGTSDLLTVGSYQIVALSAVVFLAFAARKKSVKKIILETTTVLATLAVVVLVVTKIPILPVAPVLPMHYLLYGLPFVFAVPLVGLVWVDLYRKPQSLLYPIFWLVPAVALACYGVFAAPSFGLTFTVRSINFILPPLTILVGLGLAKLWSTPARRMHGLTKIVVVLTVLSMVSVNVYSLYATVSLQEPYLGYFWRYEPSEFKAASYVSQNGQALQVAGDSKVSYLISGYFNQNVSITEGLNYLALDGSPPQTLIIYRQMYQNGYVLYQGTPISLPANWAEKLASYNCVYVNSEVSIYVRK
jgi:hypothetical protein